MAAESTSLGASAWIKTHCTRGGFANCFLRYFTSFLQVLPRCPYLSKHAADVAIAAAAEGCHKKFPEASFFRVHTPLNADLSTE
jgi:hypothetical protein